MGSARLQLKIEYLASGSTAWRKRYRKVSRYAILVSGLFLLARAVAADQRTFGAGYESVWSAAIGALQTRGNAITHSDEANGIITTDFRVLEEEELRYKFSLLLSRSGESTTVTATSAVESFEGAGAFTAAGWKATKLCESPEVELLDAIARRLLPGGAQADNAAFACRANLTIGGSMVRGSTYSTFVEFPGMTQTAAIDALMAAITEESLVVVSADKNAGIITAADEAGTGKSRIIDFAVTPGAQGVRVKATQKYGLGERGNSSNVAARFCRLLGAVTLGMPNHREFEPSTSSPVASKPSTATIEERLRTLDELFKKGLITEDEYKKKRADLLSKL
jgi:hypothetical protein